MYRLYAKYLDKKKFVAINWRTGLPAGNLIFATLFMEQELPELLKQINLPENKHIKFEIRKVK